MAVARKDVNPGPVTDRRFEDIRIGSVARAGPITVTAEEIVEFASRYDPLPMHVSDEAGKHTVHDGMIASGVLTIALKQRLIMSVERNEAIIGAATIENQKFLHPVRAGDELSMLQVCSGKRVSRSKPDRGLVTWDFEIANQRSVTVFTSRDIVMVRRRTTDDRNGRSDRS